MVGKKCSVSGPGASGDMVRILAPGVENREPTDGNGRMGGFLSHRGTPSFRPFVKGISILNHPFWGTFISGTPILCVFEYTVHGSMRRLIGREIEA